MTTEDPFETAAIPRQMGLPGPFQMRAGAILNQNLSALFSWIRGMSKIRNEDRKVFDQLRNYFLHMLFDPQPMEVGNGLILQLLKVQEGKKEDFELCWREAWDCVNETRAIYTLLIKAMVTDISVEGLAQEDDTGLDIAGDVHQFAHQMRLRGHGTNVLTNAMIWIFDNLRFDHDF